MDISAIVSGADCGEWYSIAGTNARVKIQVIKPFKMREIRERVRLHDGKIDFVALNKAIRDEAVMAWEGIEKDGAALPCTPENKELLDENWHDFNSLWNSVITSNAEERAHLAEKKRKN
jgi:hypothetical protein